MDNQSQIIGWIFRCDLCGRDETYTWSDDDTRKTICIWLAERDGWLIRDREQGGYRCPKCNEDAKR